MNNYLIETRHAATSFIDIIVKDHIEMKKYEAEMEDFVNWLQWWTALPDNEKLKEGRMTMMSEGIAKFKDAFNSYDMKVPIINSRFPSYSVACGSLLQLAKTGISQTHGSLDKCPSGRNIGTQSIKDVIWYARNQSMHYDEGTFRPPVIKCFSILDADFNLKMSSNLNQNLAINIIEIIKWFDIDAYETDMMSLIG